MERYLLVGQRHVPGQDNQMGNFHRVIELGSRVATDEEAINRAEKLIAQENKSAEPGEVVDASLCQGKRVIKNFYHMDSAAMQALST